MGTASSRNRNELSSTEQATREVTRADFMALKQAVEELHHCEANYISSEHVRESLGGKVVWDGAVSLFGLTGHPAATMCYAWSAQEPGCSARVLYAVLRMAPIGSSRDAVRASLALKQQAVAATLPL